MGAPPVKYHEVLPHARECPVKVVMGTNLPRSWCPSSPAAVALASCAVGHRPPMTPAPVSIGACSSSNRALHAGAGSIWLLSVRCASRAEVRDQGDVTVVRPKVASLSCCCPARACIAHHVKETNTTSLGQRTLWRSLEAHLVHAYRPRAVWLVGHLESVPDQGSSHLDEWTDPCMARPE